MTLIIPQELRPLLRPTRRTLMGLIVLGLVAAGLELLSVAVLLLLSSAVFGRPAPPLVTDWLHRFSIVTDRQMIIATALMFLIIVTIKFAAGMLHEFWTARWRAQVLTTLQNEVMSRYLQAPIALFFEKKQGDLINGVCTLPFKAAEGISALPKLYAAAAAALAVSGLLALLSPWVFIGALVFGGAFFGGVKYLSRRIIVPSNRGRVESQREQAEIAAETTSGIREIKFFGAELLWARRFAEQVNKFNQLWRHEYCATVMPNRVVGLVVQAGFALAVATAAYLLRPQELILELPLIATYAYGLMRVYPSFVTLGQSMMQIEGSLPHVRALEPWRALPADPLAATGQPPPILRHAIEYDNVSFTYPDGREALRGVSLAVAAGQTTAIVGPSGSGKSTAIDLLLKCVQPTTGRISTDQTDLQSVDRSRWLSRIGFVDQDVFLFHGTIDDNIRMGKMDATDAEIRSACEQAGLADFIERLPDGLRTVVGDRGLTVSGGERQRIAIARALVRQPEILIFDEATSALDNQTEALILDTLWRLKQGRTLIMIAHRLATVERADHIVVLDNGRVTENGNWGELIKRRGIFYRMCVEQGLASDRDGVQPSPMAARAVVASDSTPPGLLQPDRHLPAGEPLLIGVLGDSLSLPRHRDGIEYYHTYPLRLATDWAARGEAMQLWTMSKGGAPIAELVARYKDFRTYVGGGRGEVALVQIGIVDCSPRPLPYRVRMILGRLPRRIARPIVQFLHGHRQSLLRAGFSFRFTKPDAFARHFRRLLVQMSEDFNRVYVINICPPGGDNAERSPGLADSIVEYNRIISAAAQPYANVNVVDVWTEFGDGRGALDAFVSAKDGHHLTAAGHRRIFELIGEHEREPIRFEAASAHTTTPACADGR